jgi:hypothetical protein
METRAVDPRDTLWEVEHPTYRVHIWSPMPQPEHVAPADQAWSCSEYDVTGADVEEVLAWARDRAPSNGTYTVFLRGTDKGEPGLFRLAGWEPTRRDPPPPIS